MSREPSSPRHRALIRALRRRDPDVADRLLELYGPMLRGFLAQALDDAGDAEDVLQQTLTEIWRRGQSFDPARGSLTTWVLVIARSRAIDQLRLRIPEPFDPSDMTRLEDPSAERELDALVERWRIAGLLAALPRDEARMLALRFYEDLSQREIAERTGVALGTVKMRMARGLERLREAVGSEDAG